jgi:hypothetical protein
MQSATVIAGGSHGRRIGVCLPYSRGVWMVMMLVADPLPGVTATGAKLTVAPLGSPVALSDTRLAKVPPLAATTRLYCAALPWSMVRDGVVEVSVKSPGAIPLPLSEAVCGDPVALSATESVAA